jgi:integrase
MKAGEIYSFPAVCEVCGKDFKARYNVGARAKVCTGPAHVCEPRLEALPGGRQRVDPCVEKCCRSKFRAASASFSMNQAIDDSKMLTDEEFKNVMRASFQLPHPHGLVIRFLAGTGCRVGESLLVRREDFNPGGKIPTVRIPTSKKRHGIPKRVVDLTDEVLVAELKALVRKNPRGPFFFAVKRTVQYHFHRLMEKLGLKKSTGIHILRHTRASQLLLEGALPEHIRQQLGWASLETAKYYIHIDLKSRTALMGKGPDYGWKVKGEE